MGEPTLKLTVEQPRIYVACLAAYNRGYLHGAWIDAAQDAWDLWDAVQHMLAASPEAGSEEWAIHDYEGFGCFRIGEQEDLEKIADMAEFIRASGTLGAALLRHFEGDVQEAREILRNRYMGCYTSAADYMRELIEETTEIPQSLRYYVDWEAMARDAELSGDLFTLSTAHDQVHVFAGC